LPLTIAPVVAFIRLAKAGEFALLATITILVLGE